MIKSVSRHIGYLFPVPFLDPELLNSKMKGSSLHWIRITALFSIEAY